eukprot:CAMPEP_0114353520 /NCGR_PEP_ID=MMETSP0101-20121206/18727_1 /TAXON_ID=38822 ORGANISM="Pteridomonas danica, Strain PT" /NCGR_SAMPLE_ID=MMETSP0101 /ASSEMBLY_ACC=CAM_ASM_000211 /LENGTH=193 /DNA_ID=CAMNT_0001494401 /DNA_START=769 /DNA_END=1346 /DNA_ORIENTATION=-
MNAILKFKSKKTKFNHNHNHNHNDNKFIIEEEEEGDIEAEEELAPDMDNSLKLLARERFFDFSLVHDDDDYYLRPDRVFGALFLTKTTSISTNKKNEISPPPQVNANKSFGVNKSFEGEIIGSFDGIKLPPLTTTITSEMTATITSEMTATPTSEMTATPTSEMTATPTSEMTATPTSEMTATPTSEMTATPT